jgi:hypothetical protein
MDPGRNTKLQHNNYTKNTKTNTRKAVKTIGSFHCIWGSATSHLDTIGDTPLGDEKVLNVISEQSLHKEGWRNAISMSKEATHRLEITTADMGTMWCSPSRGSKLPCHLPHMSTHCFASSPCHWGRPEKAYLHFYSTRDGQKPLPYWRKTLALPITPNSDLWNSRTMKKNPNEHWIWPLGVAK